MIIIIIIIIIKLSLYIFQQDSTIIQTTYFRLIIFEVVITKKGEIDFK